MPSILVWHDAMSQYVGRLSPRAALETECRVNCAEEGTEFPLAEGAIWPEPASKNRQTRQRARRERVLQSAGRRRGRWTTCCMLQITTCRKSPHAADHQVDSLPYVGCCGLAGAMQLERAPSSPAKTSVSRQCVKPTEPCLQRTWKMRIERALGHMQ